MTTSMTGTAPTELSADCDCDCHHEDQHCEHCCLDPEVGVCDDCRYYLELNRTANRGWSCPS
ncbi:hypothetical protein O4158_22055 [Gordonia amicalis]|uniref:hypothetical protein n=1 Tax=Gordonia amicalis TaxID=89053 RepID=UPI0022B44F14|nr:hypothetical protein [Gordonia amicalis]MCZ4581721.1 hypothetical protein [Gordonia amicalis]